MSLADRPVPRPIPETEPFWEGCRAGELRLPRCRECHQLHFPPRNVCPHCGSRRLEHVAVGGKATLHSYVISHRSIPGFDAPYVIAVVELDEGPHMMTNLVGVEPEPDALELDMALVVSFLELTEEIHLPVFGPDAEVAGPDHPIHLHPEAMVHVAPPPREAAARRGAVAVVGAAESTELGEIPHLTPLGLHLDAAVNALADCGLSPADIDGVACAGASPIDVAYSLGITPTWLDGTWVGGCSFMIHVRHAVAAITTGVCSTVLITHGESGRSHVGGLGPRRLNHYMAQFEAPYGVWGPPSLFTVPALRWMYAHGVTEEQLAMVAVVQREWAARNERALKRQPLTVDDVLGGRMIAWPFTRDMCCLVTDGGGALVLTASDRAEDLVDSPVYVLGTGESSEAPIVSQMHDLTASRAFRVSGRRALDEAGVDVGDVDHLMAYDAFAHTPLYALEALGFVPRGEAGAFVEERHTAIGGHLPMNTNGGGLSYTHTGMYGMFALQESIRQLRGTADAQVDGVEVSVAHGAGGMFAAAGTVVMGRNRP